MVSTLGAFRRQAGILRFSLPFGHTKSLRLKARVFLPIPEWDNNGSN